MTLWRKLRLPMLSMLLALVFALPVSAQRSRRPRQEEEQPRAGLPVTQYVIAFVCGAVALWSVLRTSRRGWSK